MRDKVLYLGHEYHIKTQSTAFLKELLEEEFDVTYVSYNPYNKRYGSDGQFSKDIIYDYFICFQIMPLVCELEKKYNYKKGILFPMYDATIGLGDDWWEQYRNFVIICFSKKLQCKLYELGMFSYYIQYFPKPENIMNWGDKNSIYFWQRRENISLKTIKNLVQDCSKLKIHLHKALDPGEKFDVNDYKLFEKLEVSEWTDKKEQIKSSIENYAIYMASRQYEGIGMGFLEAMALGRCVIAPDNATMNEYIQDGYNGYLYNCNSDIKITLDNVRYCQKNAYQYIKKGYEKWEKEKRNIITWIRNDIPPKVTVITFTENNIKNRVGLKRTIESVHRQNYSNIEHVIIDNYSYDGTWEVIDKYCIWGWLKYHHFDWRVDLCDLMKQAMDIVSGKYIIFLFPGSYFSSENSIGELIDSIRSKPDREYIFGNCNYCSKNNFHIDADNLSGLRNQLEYEFQTIVIKSKCLRALGPMQGIPDESLYKYIQERLFKLRFCYAVYEKRYVTVSRNEMKKAETEVIDNPLITIITVTKNVIRSGREKQFHQAINSIHVQSYKKIEHIVIDGASDDGTIEIIKEYADKGWLVYVSEPDDDVWDAMRKGMDIANGQYINYLNTDDYFTYDYSVNKAVNCLMESQADFFYSNANRVIKDKNNQEKIEECQYFGDINTIPFGKGICHQSLFVRTNIMKELDTFNFPYRLSLDNFQMLQLVTNKKTFAYLDENLVSFREGGISSGEKTRDVYAQYFYDYVGKSFGMTLMDCEKLWVFKCFEECPLYYCLALLKKIKRNDWKCTYINKFNEVLEWAQDQMWENETLTQKEEI